MNEKEALLRQRSAIATAAVAAAA